MSKDEIVALGAEDAMGVEVSGAVAHVADEGHLHISGLLGLLGLLGWLCLVLCDLFQER